AYGGAFDDPADAVEVDDVGGVQFPDEHAEIEPVLEELLVRQQPKGLAQGVAGDAEPLGNRVLGKPVTRLEVAFHDLLAKDPGDPFRGAGALEQRPVPREVIGRGHVVKRNPPTGLLSYCSTILYLGSTSRD